VIADEFLQIRTFYHISSRYRRWQIPVFQDLSNYAIIYQATALTGLSDFKHFDASFAATNRLRTEGIDILLDAARGAGVRRIVAQSYFYGDPDDGWAAIMRARKFPVVGDGAGVWSHIHLHDVAAATVLALEHDGPAVYNIVDDEPAPSSVWLPELAKIVGAKPPQHFPRLMARLFAGEAPVIMATESRGAANAKAKKELGWTLRYPSWRQGFAAAHGQPDRLRAAA
jgi:2-alkyl-3-oxoalkanoate reductase